MQRNLLYRVLDEKTVERVQVVTVMRVIVVPSVGLRFCVGVILVDVLIPFGLLVFCIVFDEHPGLGIVGSLRPPGCALRRAYGVHDVGEMTHEVLQVLKLQVESNHLFQIEGFAGASDGL